VLEKVQLFPRKMDPQIAHFISVTGVDGEMARHFIEGAKGDLTMALEMFYDRDGGAPAAPSTSSASNAPPVAKNLKPSKPGGGIKTMAELAAGGDDDDDEDQRMYAGGEKRF
jgi:hypothetical protein